MSRKFHIVGNWKMNQKLEDIESFLNSFSFESQEVESWIAPQAMHISTLINKNAQLKVGAQNICEEEFGAFTGESSLLSLKDLGATFSLIGHSERRVIYKENNELLNKKLLKTLEHDLIAIFCIGETLKERESGKTLKAIQAQLEIGLKNLPKEKQGKVILAYEPVWAIGTGKVATPEQAEETHSQIREMIKNLGLNNDQMPILYGGSVKPENADGLLSMPNIDGALVGGASLKGNHFSALCHCAKELSN